MGSKGSEAEAALTVAKLMLVAARTAPKARGKDSVKAAIMVRRLIWSYAEKFFVACGVEDRFQRFLL